MPLQSTVAQIRLNNTITCLTAALTTLDIISDTFSTPFLGVITSNTQSLMQSVQTVKRNKNDCAQLMEQIYELLSGIIVLHTKSDTSGGLSPNMLYHVGKFAETLHKIHVFVEAQQDGNRIKQFFRQSEMSALLKDCNAGLKEALDIFKLQGVSVLNDVVDMQQDAQKTHQQVLELIKVLSEESSSDEASSMNRLLSSLKNSSNSLSMLPSEPKIFHGREAELDTILKAFTQETPRIAILGAGGMGKTSLARAALHHSEIVATYEQHRFFVACDTVSTCIELAGRIGSHLGLKPGKDLRRAVVHYFSSSLPCLLILDNLETLWEPTESRGAIEEFLSLLTDVPHLAFITTMRGAERPAKVRWSRPFLLPLKPLTPDAARQTFFDIADDFHPSKDVDTLLGVTDNMPMAINLIAHLVDFEGCSSILSRWEVERTSLLSEGHDRTSNLGLSISLSLSSPRIKALPHAKDLLSLLSILPDGLSDIELLDSNLRIDDIRKCKAALLRTSLAYTDDQQRLKTLGPIREYVQKINPPKTYLVQPLLKYFEELLQVHKTYFGTLSSPRIVAQIRSNFSNIQNLLVNGLYQENTDLVNVIYCILSFQTFSIHTGHGNIALMNQISDMLPKPSDHRLEVSFITRVFAGWQHQPKNPGALVEEAKEHLRNINDPDVECAFYKTISNYYLFQKNNIPAAMSACQIALPLAISTRNTKLESDILCELAWIKWRTGDYSGAQTLAYESQRAAKVSANLYGEANALQLEAMCWGVLGNYQHVISLCERARHLLHLCGMSGGVIDQNVISCQAEVHKLKSEFKEAHNIYTQILQNYPLEQDPYHHAYALLNLVELNMKMWAPKDGLQRDIDVAKSTFRTIGYFRGITWCNRTLADLNLREGNLVEARTLFNKCLETSWGKDVTSVTACLERLGDAYCWSGMDSTSNWTIIFLVHVLKSKQKLEVYKALKFLGDVFLAEDDQDTASSLLTIALEGFTQMDVHRSRAECMLHLGDIAKLHDNLLEAIRLWEKARQLFEKSSQEKQVSHVSAQIAGVTEHMKEEHTDKLAHLAEINAPTTVISNSLVAGPIRSLISAEMENGVLAG